VRLGGGRFEGTQIHGDDLQSLALDPGQDIPDQAPAHSIRLDQDQGSLSQVNSPSRPALLAVAE
jgi:hypothetical protein